MTTKFNADLDSQLKTLSQSQVETYHDNGFVIVRNVFSSSEVYALADDVEQVAKQRVDLIDKCNMRVRFKHHVVTGEPVFEVFDPIADMSMVANDISHDPRLFNILHDIYGEPPELFKEKLIYKPPGAEGATLHQDWIGWPGFPETFLTVLLAIDPFTAQTGATEVYPGLHKAGYMSPRDGQHHSLVAEKLVVDPVLLELEPGDIAIFSCFTPHCSAANNGATSRRGYFISFNARSDGGDQYLKHYQEFHAWIRSKAPEESRDRLFFR